MYLRCVSYWLVLCLFRSLSQDEYKAVLETLFSLLTCQLDKVPTEVLLHPFWSDFPKQHIHTNFYSQCLKNSRANMPRCSALLRKTCPRHYDANSAQMHMCHNYLHHHNQHNQNKMKESIGDFNIPLTHYHACVDTLRRRAAPCISRLQHMCENSKMRATKVVRPAMEVVKDLIKVIPNLKVIHLVRDPRDVSMSRMLMQSAHSSIAEREVRSSPLWPATKRRKEKRELSRVASAVPIEAAIFCNDVLADLIMYNDLIKTYPHSLYRLRYEDYISNPVSFANKIFDFVGLAMPSTLKKWLNSTVSTQSKYKWKSKQTVMQHYFKDVQIVCKEFYSILYPDLAL